MQRFIFKYINYKPSNYWLLQTMCQNKWRIIFNGDDNESDEGLFIFIYIILLLDLF